MVRAPSKVGNQARPGHKEPGRKAERGRQANCTNGIVTNAQIAMAIVMATTLTLEMANTMGPTQIPIAMNMMIIMVIIMGVLMR